MQRAIRILSTALITAGLVILADVGLTLAWKEPISSIYSSLRQGEAADELSALEGRFPTPADRRRLRGVHSERRKIALLAGAFGRTEAHPGAAIGRIDIPRIGLDMVVIEGTGTADLEKGPGHYPATAFPGQGTTVAIAGHRTTYLAPFRHIDSLEPGDTIRLEMPYADFEYSVKAHRIVAPTQTHIVHPTGYERLVLTACHPLFSAAERYVIFARLRSERLRRGPAP